ncbi:MAG: hypothetical protein OEY01_12285 [Desulfobulbaceae bacterium]|nr:hypothetical protein [Desulfobulbaceae bacterium]
MEEILFGIVKFIGRIIIEIPLIWTGEIILFLATCGKHKPRWDLYLNDSAGKFVLFSEMSLWLGIAFWLAICAGIYLKS